MKKFLLVAIPVTACVAAGAVLALTHKEEVEKYAKAAKIWGTEKLDKACNVACKCAKKYEISPDDIVAE